MNKWEYTRSERNALVVLLVIILLLIVLKNPIIKQITTDNNPTDSTRYFAMIEQIENAKNQDIFQINYSEKPNYTSNKISNPNVKIDINSATAEDFEKLKGIGKVYAERIVKYRNKIGGFNSLEQIKEVYGIHDTVYQKFQSNISIKPILANKNQAQQKKRIIEINSASAEDLESLNGIGKVYAGRIIQFRNNLGGFLSLEQIKDVYGIHDTVYQKIKDYIKIVPSQQIQKVNINTATYEELTANPYLFSTLAKQIIGYRTKVRQFVSIDDLNKLYYIKDHPEYLDKILPYVTTE